MAQVYIEDAPPFPPMEFIEDAPVYPEMEAPQDLMPYYGPVGTEREARGFIAPFVDEFGTTQSTAYDSLESDIAAEVQARRFKGQMDFDKLVQGGATPSEALRLTAPDLFAGDPAKMARAIPKTPASFDPSFTNVEGGRIFRRGPSSAQFIPNKAATLTPEAKARQDLLKSELFALKRAASDPISGRMVDKKRIAELEQQFIQSATPEASDSQIGALPASPKTIMTTGPEGIFMGREMAQPAQQPTSQEKVVVVKDGKRYRLPKSQLAEAEKEGYKLAK